MVSFSVVSFRMVGQSGGKPVEVPAVVVAAVVRNFFAAKCLCVGDGGAVFAGKPLPTLTTLAVGMQEASNAWPDTTEKESEYKKCLRDR